MKSPRWTTVAETPFPWEREALEFLREHLPDHTPWSAWSNFEFIDDQGRVNEVDLLVLAPRGLVLVEIKSRPGTVEGDGHSFVWNTDGSTYTEDNPLRLTNRKAKRLASLLRRQDALAKGRVRAPFVVEAVFLSKVQKMTLAGGQQRRVFLRGRPGRESDDGIIHALTGGLWDAFPRGTRIDASAARAILKAIQQAGIQPSLRDRRVGDYVLGDVIGEGEGFQDFAAAHVSQGSRRKERLEEIEGRLVELDAKLAAPPPSPVRLHPNLAETYRRKVTELSTALEDPDIRTPALEVIRGLIERITVCDGPDGVTLDLEGAITAMIDLAQPSALRDLDRSSVKVVAGAGFDLVRVNVEQAISRE